MQEWTEEVLEPNKTLGAASKLNRRLTGGSARFWAVVII